MKNIFEILKKIKVNQTVLNKINKGREIIKKIRFKRLLKKTLGKKVIAWYSDSKKKLNTGLFSRRIFNIRLLTIISLLAAPLFIFGIIGIANDLYCYHGGVHEHAILNMADDGAQVFGTFDEGLAIEVPSVSPAPGLTETPYSKPAESVGPSSSPHGPSPSAAPAASPSSTAPSPGDKAPSGSPNPASSDKKGYHIFINLDQVILYLYKDGNLMATYPVSGGHPSTPTPLGTWKVISKDSWGEGFGGAWLGFNVPWGKYGIHGTVEPWQVGKINASKGCIRMKNKDARELLKIVPHGTTVTIEHTNRTFRNMKSGDVGSDVLQVQKALKKLNYYNGAADGKFGTGLKNSVIKFQKDNKLRTTGIINTSTYSSIIKKAEEQ